MIINDNILYSTGIIAYFKGSLEFSVIGEKLLLQSGAAYDEKGILLHLMKQSYVVLDNIALMSFENHTKYYLYITSENSFNRLISEDFLTHKKLEEGIYFFITNQRYEECVLLGEVIIDYDMANELGVQNISIPYNAFIAGKNEIDIRNVKRYYLLPSPIIESQCEEISEVLLTFSRTIYQLMMKNNVFSLSTICHSFFQFSDQIKVERLSPETVYYKFKNHIKLFSWLDDKLFSEDEMKYFNDMEKLFMKGFIESKASFYHIDIDSPENLIYHILQKIQGLTQVLKEYSVEQTQMEELSKVELTEDFHLEPFVSENVTLIEDNSQEEEDSTILLGGGRDKYVQVGRGSQSGNDIIIGENDKTVSRIHLKIVPYKQGFFIEDLSSMGTYVDDKRVEKNVKKFVTSKSKVVLGKKNCVLDLNDYKIQALLEQ